MDKIDRLLVIGDIHGKWDRFWNLYQKVGFNPEHDLMVFLGDYLDRGDNPVPVMDWVLEHFGSKNMIFSKCFTRLCGGSVKRMDWWNFG